MMHHCCCVSSQGHVMGTCTCGMYHSEASSYGSMLFSVPNNSEYDMYSSFTPSPSSVDCTLSLGTPSTRLTQDDDHDNDNKRHRHQRRSGVTNFCWDMLHSKHNNNMQSQSKSISRGSSNSNNNNNNNNDPLLARRCANCDTTSTPLWRNGPRGPKSLCNACGIRFKKEERRASAAAATSAAVPGGEMESARVYGHHHNSWYAAHSQSQKMMMMGNELRFMDDSEDRDSVNNGIPFLSWKLNVPDRTSLVDERW